MKNKKNAFTLVELLAVIVILAIILVIAVPKIMNVIADSKKATLESTAKMIASAAEKANVQNTLLGNIKEITCENVAKLNDIDYQGCNIEFENNIAKVTLVGSGKFNELSVCEGPRSSANTIDGSCDEGNDGNLETSQCIMEDGCTAETHDSGCPEEVIEISMYVSDLYYNDQYPSGSLYNKYDTKRNMTVSEWVKSSYNDIWSDGDQYQFSLSESDGEFF